MADYTQDARIWPMWVALAECLCQQIAAANLPPPCFCGILPGESVALDYCGECAGGACGMAWVRLAAVAPMGSSVGIGTAPVRCNVSMEATFEVGIVRCAPMMSPDGEPPSLAAQLDAAALMSADMAAAGRAVTCCFTGREVRLAGWTPIGPQGGCAGGYWLATVSEV